jgi:hypothetical protein
VLCTLDREALKAYHGQGFGRPKQRTVLASPGLRRGAENSDAHEATPDECPIEGRDRV